MTMQSFWMKWRAEILRGSLIFVVVVGAGLALVSAFHKGVDSLKSGTRGLIPQLAQNLSASFGGDFDAPGRTHGDSWSWHSKLNPGQTLAIRNISGPVEVTAAPGTETIVTTEKSWLSSEPGSVTIQAVPTSAGTMICAVWPSSNGGECTSGHNMNVHMNGREHSDVAVKFVVQLARGVKIDVGGISGDLDISGAAAGVTAQTVSGDVSVQTSYWPVELNSVSGDISVTTGTPGADAAKVHSVSGDITISVPANPDLTVHATTMSGDIGDDFSLPVREAQYGPSQSLDGSIGKGGARLDLGTVSGDIKLNKATSVTVWRLHKKAPKAATAVTAPPAAPAVAPPARP
ncbi:MAG TPA: DUF4097 family beta strand repeat-containing protein [Gemmatimonadales bacterium]|nr:DUF4097 family beta strand repeat-containing protein [Gemmatimonadales bacterium]